MCIRRKKKQDGWTLIEIGIGVISMMVMTGVLFSKVITPFMGKLRVSEAATEVSAIINGSLDWVVGKEDGFDGMTVQLLSDDAYISEDFGSGVGQTPWGGNYTAGPDSSDDFILSVTVTSLPEEACNRLADKSPQAACAGTTVTYTIPIT